MRFPAFAPVALAGIGDLPDTILDRSIVISMKHRGPDEHIEPFRRRHLVDKTDVLRAFLHLWAQSHVHLLREIEPVMPEGIVDRAADVWEPLVMLGDFAGGSWSPWLREAAQVLNAERVGRDPSLGVRLLADCHAVFDDRAVDRLRTRELVSGLVNIDESPWGDLDARMLASRLRPFGVRPAQHRFGTETAKGYLRADFEDSWSRYLSGAGRA